MWKDSGVGWRWKFIEVFILVKSLRIANNRTAFLFCSTTQHYVQLLLVTAITHSHTHTLIFRTSILFPQFPLNIYTYFLYYFVARHFRRHSMSHLWQSVSSVSTIRQSFSLFRFHTQTHTNTNYGEEEGGDDGGEVGEGVNINVCQFVSRRTFQKL